MYAHVLVTCESVSVCVTTVRAFRGDGLCDDRKVIGTAVADFICPFQRLEWQLRGGLCTGAQHHVSAARRLRRVPEERLARQRARPTVCTRRTSVNFFKYAVQPGLCEETQPCRRPLRVRLSGWAL